MESLISLAAPIIAKHGGQLAKSGLKHAVKFVYNKLLSDGKGDIIKHPVNELKNKASLKTLIQKKLPSIKDMVDKKKFDKKVKAKSGKKLDMKVKKPKPPTNATHGHVAVHAKGRKTQIIKFSENENLLSTPASGAILEGSTNRTPLLSGPESSIANESNIIDKIAVKQLHPKDPFVAATVDGIRIRGVEYITRLAIGSTTSFGNTIYTMLFNPATWIGSRAQKYAQLYEKYFFRSVEVQYEPIVSKMEPGQIGMAIYHNAAREVPPNSEMGYRQLITQKDAIAFPVYQVQTMSHDFVTPSAPYYVAPDASYNDSIAGNMINQARLVVKDGSGLIPGKVYVSIIVKYDISFYDSTLFGNSTMVQFSSAGVFTFPVFDLQINLTGAPVNTTGLKRFFAFVPSGDITWSSDAWATLISGRTYFAEQGIGLTMFTKIYASYLDMLSGNNLRASYTTAGTSAFTAVLACFQIALEGVGLLTNEKINTYTAACLPSDHDSEEELEADDTESDTVASIE